MESEIQELQNLKIDLMTNIERGTKKLEQITNYLNEKLIKYDVELTYPFDLLEVDSSEINTHIKKLEMKERDLVSLEK